MRSYPAYYIPVGDILADLVPTGNTDHSPRAAATPRSSICARRAPPHGQRRAAMPGRRSRNCARRCAWTGTPWTSGSEDEPVYTHPRDPYSRVNILASSPHVRIDIDGVTVASTSQPRILFETGLPPRYYLPLTDVRLDLLRPSATQSHCPYKGTASYSVPGHGHRSPPGLRLDIPVPAAGKPEDRRARLLLQREGRLLPRRRPPAAAADEIQLTGARHAAELTTVPRSWSSSAAVITAKTEAGILMGQTHCRRRRASVGNDRAHPAGSAKPCRKALRRTKRAAKPHTQNTRICTCAAILSEPGNLEPFMRCGQTYCFG